MRNIRWVPVALVVLSFAQATASPPDERTLAEELLALTNAEKTSTDMRAEVGKMMTAQFSSMKIPDEMRDKMATFQQQILAMVFEELSFAKMKSDYIDVYATTFSADELAGLVEFYKGPVGKAYADKMPVLTKRMLEISQARTQALIPRIEKMNADFIADLVKAATKE